MHLLDHLNKEKIMAMIRGVQPDAVDRTVEALTMGGVRFLEVTTNTEGVYSLVERLRKAYGHDLFIGVGTVLNVEMARNARRKSRQSAVDQFGSVCRITETSPGVCSCHCRAAGGDLNE
ncbi:hypothetical protein O9H85_11605 [Paenibacillus filicis]|uniref:Bifunctional 4-hydroxy-2-oxoglutarate aldolase/2-dehydro-3-deoxy-phosphogluconate aldolase n=1 Tax=Paenibacillus gyeongsangnamensis TaxID=3388067 RepID=A0ABT4Q857_9BACL|nr:hypothetical protein [Paenibacillus filicis]MCZ8513057.1 hypothetical protein [Paenibacillus filicis]